MGQISKREKTFINMVARHSAFAKFNDQLLILNAAKCDCGCCTRIMFVVDYCAG